MSHPQSNSNLITRLHNEGLIKHPDVIHILRNVDRNLFYNLKTEPSFEESPMDLAMNSPLAGIQLCGLVLEWLTNYMIPGARVLSIGTENGYLLVCIAKFMNMNCQIVGIEQDEELVETARANIRRLCPELFERNIVSVIHGDTKRGAPDMSPFNAIFVGYCCPGIPENLLNQLGCRGRMVIPLGETLSGEIMMVIDKDGIGNIHTRKAKDYHLTV
jgi:protein-L-isoaspartate(D-aspartate) O-methyltransferase